MIDSRLTANCGTTLASEISDHTPSFSTQTDEESQTRRKRQNLSSLCMTRQPDRHTINRMAGEVDACNEDGFTQRAGLHPFPL